MRRLMIGEGDWNASGERWTARCVDCQSMVPDLSPAVDGMNKRRTLMVIFNEVSARIKLRGMWNGSTGFWGEWKAATCRYRFILMEANNGRETSVVSLMEFNDSIRVLSPLYRLLSKHSPHHNHLYLWKYGPFIRYSLAWRLLSSFDNELSIIRLEHCAKLSLFWSICCRLLHKVKNMNLEMKGQ